MDRWELWATTDLTEWTHILDISPTSTYLGINQIVGPVILQKGMVSFIGIFPTKI